jgi:CRISPR-associated protein Cas1
MYALINVVGLDPYTGFFHEIKHGHAALASDLMEEWRPIIVDSLVLFLVNRGELTGAHFRHPKPDQVRLTKEGLARFVHRYEDRLASRVHHPRLQKQLSYRQCLEAQVRHLVECISGKAKTYQPFQAR